MFLFNIFSKGLFTAFQAILLKTVPSFPDSIDFTIAAASILQGMTAHYLAYSTFQLRPEHTCLIHAGAGGVGLLLIQMAKNIGAKVITTVSTEEKKQLALEAGADEVVIYTKQNFVDEVSKITKGKGLPVVYDSVGNTTFDGSIDLSLIHI